MRHYDVIVIGAGPGGIFATYELAKKQPELSIAVFEAGHNQEESVLLMVTRFLTASIVKAALL